MSASANVITARQPFDEIYSEFLPRITGFLRTKLSDRDEAEDVAAIVFARAFKAYPRFELRGKTPAAWLFQIARNAACDHHHQSRRRQCAERAVADLAAEAPDPTHLAEERFGWRQLRYAIARLPQRQRVAVTLRHDEELSFKEIGARLGCSEDAAKMLYHRSLRALRPLVTDSVAA